MFKKNQQIRLNNTLYLIENIILVKNGKFNHSKLKDLKNKTVNWYSKPMIKKSLSQIVANKPLKYNDLSVSLLENGFHTTIDIYDGLNHYSKNVNECTSNALSTFAKKFKYFNNLTPKTLLKEGFIKSSEQPLVEQFGGQLFYHGSHTKDITTFNGNVFWSTSVDFAEQYGPIIYQAQLDLGKCFDISLKQHLEWLLKQTGGKIEYEDDDYNDKYIFGVNDYKKIANNNWETVEKYLPIIKGSFNSCKIVEEGTVNYIVFNNTQIKLLKVFNRRLDETVVCEDYAKDKEQRLKAEALADTIIKTLHKKSTEIIPSKDYFVVNMTKEFIKTCPELKKTGRQFLILLGNETKNPFHALGNLSNDENSEASLIYLPVIPERLTSSQFFDYVYALRHKQVDKIKKECYDKNYSQESMINIIRTYMYNEVRKELYKTPAAKGLFSYNDVLVHELTHLLDNIRYTPTYKSHAQDTTSDKGLNDYYNSSEEQNAYYQETIYRFKQYIKNLQQMNINLSSIKSFDDFLNVFKYKYAGNFSRLTDKNKRRFTKRVYQYWKNAIADKEDIINESATLETNKPITIIGYHGTTKDFDNFDKKFVKNGFYFATKQRLQSLAGYYAGKNGYIIKAKIHFEHPFVGTPSQFQDLEMYHYKEMMTKYDGIISVSDGTIPSSQSYYNYKTEKLEYENLNVGDIIEMVVWNPNQIEIIKKVKLKELNESTQNKLNKFAYQYDILYHGTNNNFNEFKKEYQKGGYLGKGFYFTMSKSMAKSYGPNIISVKLKNKNSFFFDSDVLSEQQVREMLNTTNAQDYQREDMLKKYQHNISNMSYYNANSQLFDFVDIFNGDSTAILQKYGYDSIDNIDRDSEIVVFEPNQIKIISKEKLNESVQNKLNDNFWKWFGNSKVVDEQGRPLVVYHGSPHKLIYNVNYVENINKIIKRMYEFVNKPDKYKYITIDKMYNWRETIYEFLKKYPDFPITQKELDGIEQYIPFEIFDISKSGLNTDSDKNSGIYFTDSYDAARTFASHISTDEFGNEKLYTPSTSGVFSAYLSIQNPFIGKNITDKSIEKYKAMGYDGIINVMTKHKRLGVPIKREYIVFNPNQIKSINNNGEWNPNSNNIFENNI